MKILKHLRDLPERVVHFVKFDNMHWDNGTPASEGYLVAVRRDGDEVESIKGSINDPEDMTFEYRTLNAFNHVNVSLAEAPESVQDWFNAVFDDGYNDYVWDSWKKYPDEDAMRWDASMDAIEMSGDYPIY